MKQVIPTHDPQTGELNPFYQELTGQSNPLSCKPHLIWWNELPKEKQYTLNYHYFGQPDLGETDFLTEDDIKKMDEEMQEDKANMEEDGMSSEDLPPPPPPAPPPQQLVVSVKKEETENTRVVDDVDQRELAKSMTAFFGTLVEEAKGDKEGN